MTIDVSTATICTRTECRVFFFTFRAMPADEVRGTTRFPKDEVMSLETGTCLEATLGAGAAALLFAFAWAACCADFFFGSYMEILSAIACLRCVLNQLIYHSILDIKLQLVIYELF